MFFFTKFIEKPFCYILSLYYLWLKNVKKNITIGSLRNKIGNRDNLSSLSVNWQKINDILYTYIEIDIYFLNIYEYPVLNAYKKKTLFTEFTKYEISELRYLVSYKILTRYSSINLMYNSL